MRAFITGITGQDGSYLAEHLLEEGYEVAGFIRRASTPNFDRISHLQNDIRFFDGDLTDSLSIASAIEHFRPDEVYHLGAQSFVGTSWTQPEATANITGLGTLRVLEAIRQWDTDIRFYQAASSEQFGKVREVPQTESTPFHPRSPYGVAKCFAHYITTNYRESYGLHASNGILFNHESPRRGLEFVTRKITYAVARIYFGLQDEIRLGNLDPKRDWGHAYDYVRAMRLIVQHESPGDYVIATGQTHSIREFLDAAFSRIGVEDWTDRVVIDPEYVRPAEVDLLVGDPAKAIEDLGWKPVYSFEDLVNEMVENDLQLVESELAHKRS